MSARPTNIALVSPDRLRMTWDDAQVREYSVRELRDKCPCATCREKRNAPPPPTSGLTVLSMAETQPLRIVDMKPIGNYAYGIAFSDGHDTGIFTLEFLRELGQERQ
jgi:DUF971 family protein